MEVNNRITLEVNRWPRCSAVALQNGVFDCSLTLERTYDLTSAYKSDLHIRFLNAHTDRDLIAFIRAWGPLYLSDEHKQSKKANLTVSYFRAFQRWIRALVNLLNAFKLAEGERTALLEFIEAEYEYEAASAFHNLPAYEPIALSSLRYRFHIAGDILNWAKDADAKTVRAATDYLVPFAPVHPLVVNLTCRREREGRYVAAGWTFLNLEEALRWMVWYDEFTQHPIVCCQECRDVFRVDSRHARKYCRPEHARRATARNWQRDKRAKERAERK